MRERDLSNNNNNKTPEKTFNLYFVNEETNLKHGPDFTYALRS